MTGVLRRERRILEKQHRAKEFEDGGRVTLMHFTNQGSPGIAGKHHTLCKGHGTNSYSDHPERTNPSHTMGLTSRILKESISVVLNHLVCGNMLWQP